MADKYDASQITVLEGLEPVRKRPGMYIGSTDSRGLHECLREIIDNSVDESFAGTATEVWVQIKADGSAEVRDNGRGIPLEIQDKVFEFDFTTKLTRGTGLGLGIVEKICKEFGATPKLQSAVGEGTEFLICFQAIEEARSELKYGEASNVQI